VRTPKTIDVLIRSPRRGRGFWFSVAIDLIWVLVALATRLRWSGKEHLPRKGGVLVASNHLSMVDPIPVTAFVLAARRIPRYLAMAELWKAPVIKWVVAGGKHIPVERRSTRAVQALHGMVDAVGAGECVVVFPEGGIGRQSDHWPEPKVKNGVARVALESKAPVIPVAIWGSHELLPADTKKLKLRPRKTIQVVAGPPVELSDLYDAPRTKTTLDEATKRIMAAITEQLATLRG